MSLLPDFLSVNGRTAIVTGAASGIGKSTVLMFAAAGARVVAVDMDAKGAEATVGRRRATAVTRSRCMPT
jgi:NAD(P)-dependent dehydrogenase (short-subunit alcohol dehydrogenase family)